MKTFSTHTMIALTSGVGIAMVSLRNPTVGLALMLFVLPVAMVVIGLTSPQKGNQLDPSERWYLFVIAKTWVFTLIVLILSGLFWIVTPFEVQNRIVRAMRGDLRRYQFEMGFHSDRKAYEALMRQKVVLYDKQGFIGEVREISCTEKPLLGKLEVRIWIKVSTDREDSHHRDLKMHMVDIRNDGTLFVMD